MTGGARAVRLVLGLGLLAAPLDAAAFLGGDAWELRGTILANDTFARLPALPSGLPFGLSSSAERQVNLVSASARLLADWTVIERRDEGLLRALSAELHAVVGVSGATRSGLVVGLDDRLAVSLYEGRQSVADAVIDRLNVSVSLGPKLDLQLGRQPINLATSFYFVPNDVFAPFAAQAFFRLYKPGVDGLRMSYALGELSLLSLYVVAGPELELERASALVRASTVVFDELELAALGGRADGRFLLGGSFQGGLFDGWLGLRGEGHVAIWDADRRPDAQVVGEATVNLEHRFESTLSVRAEVHYHGAGATDAVDYRPGSQLYLGRAYAAFGVGYELFALTYGEALAIVNLLDGSALTAIYVNQSLLDEAELGVSASLPLGAAPSGFALASEFGAYPASLDVQLRWFF
jgi:hypothetical protein